MNRTSRFRLGCVAVLWLAAAVTARAQTQTFPPVFEVKVGTLAPEGTPWHDALQEIGAGWKKASGGQIAFTIFAGTQGEEADMIRRM